MKSDSMQLISKKEANRELLRTYRFEITSLGDYMRYCFILLEKCFDFDMISKERKESIAAILLKSFQKKAGGSEMVMANIVYIFSYWLLSLTSENAFDKLDTITDVFTADMLVNEALEYLQKQIERQDNILKSFSGKIQKMESQIMKQAFLELSKNLSILKKYAQMLVSVKNVSEYGISVNLKKLHNSNFLFVNYTLLWNPRGGNYFETLKMVVNSFCIEISILAKVNGKDVLQFLQKNEAESVKKRFSEGEAIDDFYSQKLKDLEKEYAHNMELYRLQEFELDKMAELGEAEYDNYLEKISVIDDVELTEQFSKAKIQLEEEWKAELSKFEESASDEDSFDAVNWLADQRDQPLEYMLKYMAYMFRIKRGADVYPEDEKHMILILDNMKIADAISEILLCAENLGLSKAEVEYLEKIK